MQRLALPSRVHNLWDAIERGTGSGAVGPVDFQRLMGTVTSIHKIPQDEFNRELENAVKDGLVIEDAMQTQKREEITVYKLPDRDFTKGDHDWYCFQCHFGGVKTVVSCEDCPRIYHLDCLAEDKKPEKDLFVCPSCSAKPRALGHNLTKKQLNQLLVYSCQRFYDWVIPFLNNADGKVWVSQLGLDESNAWRYEMLVYFPIDLTQMLEKAKGGKYSTIEEFQLDCETLLHGIAVFFGLEQLKKGQNAAAAFQREVLHDIQEIRLCPDCFRSSNEKSHPWWFCLPCTVPHSVVWAKQSGYPYWPAKVMKKDGSKFDVRYFGGNYERGMIDIKNIQPIETPLGNLRIRKTAAWNEAYDELQKFQEIALDGTKVELLPKSRGGKGASPSKANTSTSKSRAGSKRAATSSPVEEVSQKKPRKSAGVGRKSATVQATTPVTGRARKSLNQTISSPMTGSSTGVQSNGVTLSTKKKAATPKPSSSATHRRDSTSRLTDSPVAGRSRVLSKDISFDSGEHLDQEDVDFIKTLVEDIEADDSLSGDAYFSEEEQDEHLDKVSEDAVSSSVNESKKGRNVYVQTSFSGITGRLDAMKDSMVEYLKKVKERQSQDTSALKKKQWCYHCEREAIYHCCWNTAYCSIECQQLHWTKEHKRLCRRVRRDRSGTGNNNQGADDY